MSKDHLAPGFPEFSEVFWPDGQRPASLVGQLAFVAGRVYETLGLVVVGGLSLLLLGVLFVLLLVAMINASFSAALLTLLAMAGILYAFFAFRRRTRQTSLTRLSAAALPEAKLAAEFATLEAGRIQKLAHLTLRAGGTLTPVLRTRLNAAASATRDALRTTAASGVLTREAHDARQAADDDLPAALAAYQELRLTGQPLSYGEVLLAEQLSLIERRMNTISAVQAEQHTRKLEAGSRYLKGKYGEEQGLGEEPGA